MIIIATYIVYLCLSAVLVILVGYWFYHFGEVYIIRLFWPDEQTAKLLNKMLLIGYYLLNLGFILYFLQTIESMHYLSEAINFIVKHLANNIIVIALMHYCNMTVIYWISKKKFLKNQNT